MKALRTAVAIVGAVASVAMYFDPTGTAAIVAGLAAITSPSKATPGKMVRRK